MIKLKTYKLLEKGDHGSKFNQSFDYFIVSLILLNVVAISLETIPELSDWLKRFLKVFENISIIIFTIEYLLRIYVSELTHATGSRLKSAFKFIFSFYGIVDLLSILPFFLPFFFTIDLRFIRLIRLSRFIRIFKIHRYHNSVDLIFEVVKEKKMELGVTCFLTFLILLIASFLMYYIEGPVQPESFPNVLASFWWAIATLTTVGYGDVYPITGFGKLVSGIIAVLGIGLVALPTGLISAGFIEKVGKSKDEHNNCPHCGKSLKK